MRSPKSSHAKLLQRAKAMQIKQNVSIHLSKTAAKKLARESNKQDITVDEMAGKIISTYLKRRKRQNKIVSIIKIYKKSSDSNDVRINMVC